MMISDFYAACPPPSYALYQLTLLHSIGIANFMLTYAVSHGYDTEFAEDLYLLGLLSRIGYLNNPDGIAYEKRSFSIAIRNNVFQNKREFAEALSYQETFINNPSKPLQLLWLARLCISLEGDYIGYMNNYNYICEAYKSNEYDKNRFENNRQIIEYLSINYPDYS